MKMVSIAIRPDLPVCINNALWELFPQRREPLQPLALSAQVDMLAPNLVSQLPQSINVPKAISA